MAVKILWTKRAERGFSCIVSYLQEEWTEKEVAKSVVETAHFFELLKKNLRMLQKSKNKNGLFRGPINRLTILTYLYKPGKNEIILVNIRSSRQRPAK